jgi:hypothetical protein
MPSCSGDEADTAAASTAAFEVTTEIHSGERARASLERCLSVVAGDGVVAGPPRGARRAVIAAAFEGAAKAARNLRPPADAAALAADEDKS